jgi:hypothetical protein
MEPVFEIPYLIGVVVLGILILRSANGNKQFIIYGIMAVILGCGDAFHLVPRMYALLTDGIANHVSSLGFGKMITSITMTVFYVILYHVWKMRFNKLHTTGLTTVVYLLAVARLVLCLLPQNKWLSADAPLEWGIYRNIPFVILGVIVIVAFFCDCMQNNDKAFRFMWLAITLSFAFLYLCCIVGRCVPDYRYVDDTQNLCIRLDCLDGICRCKIGGNHLFVHFYVSTIYSCML